MFNEQTINRAIDAILKKKSFLLAFPTGIGKTRVCIEAIKKSDFKKIVIISTLGVAKSTWFAESKKWGLKGYELHLFHGADKNQIVFNESKKQIFIANYEGLKAFLEHFKKNTFDIVFFDESTRAKNRTSTTCKLSILLKEKCKQSIPMTGTVTSNSVIDLYGQICLLDEKIISKGLSFSAWRKKYFNYKNMNYKPKFGTSTHIKNIAAKHMISIEEKVLEKLLPRIEYKKVTYCLTDYQRYEYDLLAESLNTKLQICSGFFYENILQDGKPFQKVNYFQKNPKAEAFRSIIKKTSGKKRMICVAFNAEKDLVSRILQIENENYRILMSTDEDFQNVVDDWNGGKIRNIIVHPKSMAYGVNLQFGGHTIIWYGVTASYEYFKQTNARIWRRGQKYPVTVYKIEGISTLEVAYYRLLEKKKDVHNYFLA